MSTTAESPVHSSSSDDFAAILETELDSNTSGTSPDSHVSFALEDVELERTKRQRVYETEEADVRDSVALEYKVCPPHPGFIRQMCIRCGQLEDAEASVPFDYIHKDLKLGTEEVARLRNADIKNLLSRQKLYLILDLDHTLLNSTRLADISPQEEAYVSETYLKHQSDASRGPDFLNTKTTISHKFASRESQQKISGKMTEYRDNTQAASVTHKESSQKGKLNSENCYYLLVTRENSLQNLKMRRGHTV